MLGEESHPAVRCFVDHGFAYVVRCLFGVVPPCSVSVLSCFVCEVSSVLVRCVVLLVGVVDHFIYKNI